MSRRVRFAVFISVVSVLLLSSGCQTAKGVASGAAYGVAYGGRGFFEDVDSACKATVAGVMKADNWIKENLW